MRPETLIPKIGVVTDIRVDTPDVKTFRVVGLDGKKVFEHIPGQCAMLSVPGVGEGMFSITSSPTNEEFMEFSIKKCGCLTSWLHMMDVGQQITIRGPYGNGFPVESALKGKDLLFIAGGIGLAPLRSVINYVRDKKDNYGSVHIIYGSRSVDDLVDYQEILNEWQSDENGRVDLKMSYMIPAMGASWIYSELCRRTEAGSEPDSLDLRTSDHDQVYTGWLEEDGIPGISGLHYNGIADEVCNRKMRSLQHRK